MLVIRLVGLEDWVNIPCEYSAGASKFMSQGFSPSESLMDVSPQLSIFFN